MLNSKIIIPVNQSSNANNAFDPKHLIQVDSFNKVIDLIQKQLKLVDQDDANVFNRVHEAITLLGERGSGKTSFLLNLQNMIKQREPETAESLLFLEILDPTLFESKQHVMLTIISIMIQAVGVAQDKEDVDADLKNTYMEKLNALAEGINLLDGVDSGVDHRSMWEDARINFNKGINNSKHGINFEKDFKEFVKVTLKYLRKKVFILMFDDIDTNIEKGWPVLEVIRKYLTLREIQIIVSGDWVLFKKLVRVNQYKNLNGIKDIDEVCECSDRYDYLKTLDMLEEQYLTKILKPENRVLIENLYSLITKEEIYVINEETQINSLHEKDRIEKLLERIMQFTLNTRKTNDLENIKKIFLTLPLRSNIQLYKSFFELENVKKEKFISEMGKQFLTELTRFDITLHDLNELQMNQVLYSYITKAFKIQSKNEDLSMEDFFNISQIELFGEYQNQKNILFYILKSYITAAFDKNIGFALEWMLKIELYQLIHDNHKNYYIDMQTDMKYLGYWYPIKPYEYTIRLLGYLNFQSEAKTETRNDYILGYTKVYKDESKKGSVSFDYFIKQIEKHTKEKDTYLLLSSILFNKVNAERSSKYELYGSLYFVLGFLSELLNAVLIKNSTIEEFLSGRKMNGAVRPYSNEYTNPGVHFDAMLASTINHHIDFLKDMEKWAKDAEKVEAFSLNTLQSAIEDYFFQEEEIEYQENFADYIRLQTILFLNALLYADIKNICNTDTTNRLRIRSSDTALKRLRTNINHAPVEYAQTKNITLFNYFLSCPIWEYLIGEKIIIEDKNNIKRERIDNSGGLFDIFEEETSSQEEDDVFNNEYFNLLRGLKTHKIGNRTVIGKILENLEAAQQEKIEETMRKHTIENYVELFEKNKEKLSKYFVLNEDEITKEITDNYLKVLRKYYPDKTRFTAERKNLINKAIVEFSNRHV